MICNILGCSTEAYFKILYLHYNNSKKPFAREIMRVCENHAKEIGQEDSTMQSQVLHWEK